MGLNFIQQETKQSHTDWYCDIFEKGQKREKS